MTTDTLTHENSPSSAREDMHMDADTFSLASLVLSPPSAFQCPAIRLASDEATNWEEARRRFWVQRPRPGELGSAEREAKQDRALALRREGKTYFAIAVELGYGSMDTCYYDVRRALAREGERNAA